MPRVAPNKRKLTALYLQKLKPQARAYLVWDAHQRGLALRVEPTGYRAWKVVYPQRGCGRGSLILIRRPARGKITRE
jgi:hypothetical protein